MNRPQEYRAARRAAVIVGAAAAIGLWSMLFAQVDEDDPGGGESPNGYLSSNEVPEEPGGP